MKDKTLFEGIKCLTRRYTIFALIVLALAINVLFYLVEYVMQQRGVELSIWYHQLILLLVSTVVITGVVSVFLINLDAIRDEMVANLKKLIAIIRNQTPQDLVKKIELEDVSCDDEVFQIVDVLNQRSEQIAQYINHLKYVIGYIQHEFNTPLATLALGIQRLEKNHPDIDMSSLEEEVHDLSKIMNSLSYLTYKDTKNIVCTPVAVLPVIEKAIGALSRHFPDAAIAFHGDSSLVVESHDIYLHIIVKNLLENALKYSSGEKKVDITFRDDIPAIEIQDYGKGMSADEVKHMGLPFWQADASRGEDSGFGLGLTLVYELATMLGIQIAVDSQKDIGTTFTLQFLPSHDA